MKVGDIVTTFNPVGNLITGVAIDVAPLKTRSGWTVGLAADNRYPLGSYILRPEDEGSTWMYGEDQKAKDALLVSNALGEHTVVSPLQHLVGKRVMIKARKRGSV